MNGAPLDVVGIGNAIVDVLSQESDDFVDRHGLVKGSMQLIDAAEAGALYADLGPAIEASGGSAANTMVGIASLGGAAAFIGKVADDQLGAVFTHDIRAAGVEFATPPLSGGPPTAQSLVIVTPDAHRTMNTFLGASTRLAEHDIDAELIGRAEVLYLEGYLWDPPQAKQAFRAATAIAKDRGTRVALTLSDAFCVDRFRDEFLDLIARDVDILMANEGELCSLFEVDDFDVACRLIAGSCEIIAVTRSELGSVILAGDERHAVAAHPAGIVVDTTGAGDAYAAGLLFGFTHGYPIERAGRLGSLCAAEVIAHLGPRPAMSLAELAERELH